MSDLDKNAAWDETRVRRAQQYLERATALDSTDIVAKAWLEKVIDILCHLCDARRPQPQLPILTRPQTRGGSPDSDDEEMTLNGETDGERHKRARTTPA